jgi:hypothetical protein
MVSWDDAFADTAMVVSAVLFPPFLFLTAILVICGFVLYPFGREATAAALVSEVAVESIPLGTWPLHLVTHRRTGGGISLSHSSYDEPRVARLIASWIREREERRR